MPFTVKLGEGRAGVYELSPRQQRSFFKSKRQLPTPIGCGRYACAYPVGRRVVKFTSDPTDALAAERVRRRYGAKGHRHLVSIHRVYELGDPPFGPWAIVADRLQVPPPPLAGRQTCAAHAAGAAASTPEEAISRCLKAATTCSRDYGGDLGWYCDYYRQALRGVRALRRVGVRWNDSKIANFGYRDGRWLILDFGSSLVGRIPLDRLEGVKR